MKSFPLLFGALMVTTFLQAQLVTGDDIAVANTENGQVRGYIHNTIFTYKGIPYAEAKRFETPGKPQPWTGIRSSMTYGPVAPLVDPTTTVMDESEFVFHHDWGYTSEDCMRLNIWTPALDGKKRPVLFWMHGGGFTAGSSQELPSYDGESLAKSGDVVVVSINHRLNILGFLDLSAYGDPFKTSANNSMLDLVMALQWVRDNISNFGGDPGNVTIFGQSGGGAKVNTLMAMPMAKGLFHKAINQSGAIRSDMFEKPVTQAIGAAVLDELGIAPGEVAKIQEIPFDLLAAAGKKALKRVENQLKAEGKPISVFGLNWGPSVDDEVLPYQLFSDQAMDLSRDIPLLIGTVKNEFMASLGSGMTHATLAEVEALIKQQRGEKAEAFLAAVREAFPNPSMPSDLMDVDVLFRPGAVFQADTKSAIKGGAPVYMYLFAWQSPVMDGKYKAVHCMELPFVFNNIARCEEMTGGRPEAYTLANRISQAWIQFARTGNPNHAGLPGWGSYTQANGTTMFFDNECTIRHHHDQALLKLIQP